MSMINVDGDHYAPYQYGSRINSGIQNGMASAPPFDHNLQQMNLNDNNAPLYNTSSNLGNSDGNTISSFIQFLREEQREREKEIDRLLSVIDKNTSKDSEEQIKIKSLKIPIFDESESIDVYLRQYEKICKIQSWKESSWAVILSTHLTGKARDVFIGLSDEDANHYPTLKAALLSRYQLSAEVFRKKLRNINRDQGETFKQMVYRMDDALSRWIEMSKKKETFEDLKDLILYEQLLDNCGPDLAVFIRERRPDNVIMAAELAQTFVEARCDVKRDHKEKNYRRITNNSPGQTQTNIHSNNDNQTNQKQDGSVHGNKFDSTKIQSQTFSRTPISGNSIKCYKCSGPHLARQCPTQQNQNNGEKESSLAAVSLGADIDPRFCYKAKINGIPTNALRDTGAQTVCVSKHWIPKSCAIIGEANLTFAEKDSQKTCPIVEVPIETPFLTGKVQVVVMDNPITPLIIGNKATLSDGTEISIDCSPRRTESSCHASKHEVDLYSLNKVDEQKFSQNSLDENQSIDNNQGDDKKHAPVTRTNEQIEQTGIKDISVNVVKTRAMVAKEATPDQPLNSESISVGHLGPNQISTLQKSDESLKKYWSMAETSNDEYHKNVNYCICNGLLFRRYKDKKGEVFKQLVVPTSLRKSVISIAHDTAMAGHMGNRRTLNRIWQTFYWPGICTEVRRFCQSCDICQKTSPKVRKVMLGRTPTIEEPFRRVAVDLIGPIKPISEKGNAFILVMIDYGTRFPDAVALKRIDSVSISEALFEMWSRVGIPSEVLTDRGSQFTGEVMRDVFRLLGIKGLTTTPYHAQCNGLVENFNGTLKTILRKLCVEKPKDWDRFIPAALFSYREVPQESLKFSPFELLYGRQVRGPMTLLKDIWTNDKQEGDVRSTVEHVLELKDRIAETCKIAHENLGKAKVQQAKYFNKKAVVRTFKAGDLVLLLLPEKHNKLQLAWRGPFYIKERVNDVDYKIQIGNKVKMYHANLLKRYVLRSTVATAAVVIEQLDEDKDEDENYNSDVLQTKPESGIPFIALKQTETFEDVVIAEKLPQEKRLVLQEMCRKFQSQFTDVPTNCNIGQCDINVITDDPIFVKQYPLPHSQEDTIKEEVRAMLDMDIIEPASSPYSSPVILAKKKEGSVRFCIDFRKLNKFIQFDGEPMVNVDALFAKLGSARYFSKLDLTKGYWAIPMKESDKHKTAFSTPFGQFQFKRMPFGLKTAGAVFSRTMRRVLEPLELNCLHNFMDDMLVATDTWDEHVEALQKLLNRLKEVNLVARPAKCFLGFEQVSFLGHQVGCGKLKPEEDKVEKLRCAPRPETKKQLRSFLGLSGYYRRFVPNYAQIALPLTDLTKKCSPEKIPWDESCELAFNELKDHLSKFPIVLIPDQSRPFVLRTDASGEGLGAALMQDQGDGLQPLAYASKKLSKAEKNYATIEQECLAVVWGIRKFYPYLYGREFIVETDHNPLQYLDRIRPMSRRLMGWAIELQSHVFSVRSIPGSTNVEADTLSRL